MPITGTAAPRVRELLAAALLCHVAEGCALNPVSGRPEVVLVTRAQERKMGEHEARGVAATMGLVDAPALTAYVSAVGHRLAEQAPGGDAYTFNVVDAEEPNAFSLPGGYVYVCRGLLVLMNSEDELAGVLGHEIGHVAARHAVSRVTRAAPLAVVTGLGAAVTGIVSPTLGSVVGGIGGLAGEFVLAPYSRGQEAEADQIGQELAARAGWDPAGLTRALQTLEREEALHAGEARPMAFFATHPPLPSRVADTAARAGGLQRGSAAPITATRAEFLRRLDGLPVDPRPGDGVVEGERFAHPDFGFELRFPAGWKVANGRQTVAAVAPGRDAMIVLEGAGNGTDPTVALQAFEKQAGIDLSSVAERFEVNGLPAVRAAARARTREGPLVLEITWVAQGDRIYRIAGATTPSRIATFQPAFREAAASFRPLTAAERGSFREFRLRLVAARGGETLAQLLTRANAATWSTEMVAVANGLEAGTPLRGGELLKVPRAEPYRPR